MQTVQEGGMQAERARLPNVRQTAELGKLRSLEFAKRSVEEEGRDGRERAPEICTGVSLSS